MNRFKLLVAQAWADRREWEVEADVVECVADLRVESLDQVDLRAGRWDHHLAQIAATDHLPSGHQSSDQKHVKEDRVGHSQVDQEA